jgi:hypothetical protein
VKGENAYFFDKNASKVNMHMVELGYNRKQMKDFKYSPNSLANKNVSRFSTESKE